MADLGSYLREFRDFAGSRLWLALALVAISALLEALGLLALLPAFSLVAGETDNAIAQTLLGQLNAVGLATPLSQALVFVCAFVVLIAVRGLVQYRRDIVVTRLGLEFVDVWRTRVLTAISAADWRVLLDRRRTDIEHSVMVDLSRLAVGTTLILGGIVQCALIVIQLMVVAIIAPAMLLVSVLLIGTAAVFAAPVWRKARRVGLGNTVSGRRVHYVFSNFLAGQKLARLHDMEDRYLGEIGTIMREARQWQVDFVGSRSAMRAVFQCAAAAAIALLLLVGYFVMGIGLPALVVFAIVLTRIAGPAQQLIQTAQAVANVLPAYSVLQTLIADLAAFPAPDSEALAPRGSSTRESQTAAPIVEARDIWFAYRPGQWVLQGASLSLAPGEFVALDAASGAGKTTLLDIVTGLIPAASGAVHSNGRLLSSPQDWAALRSRIAYLPQDPLLFDATLRENLRWFEPAANEAQMADALALAGADVLLERSPEGLDTRIGDRGLTLSGGERQRVCLARALLSAPELLILDEATNAMDEASEREIVERLRSWRQRPAILLVAHRREIRELADRTFHLVTGRTSPGMQPRPVSAVPAARS